MENLPAYLISGAGLLFTLGAALYNAGRNRGFQESIEKSFNEFKEETRRKLNGMPVSVAKLEQIAHDHAHRITKHKLEQDNFEHEMREELRKR